MTPEALALVVSNISPGFSEYKRRWGVLPGSPPTAGSALTLGLELLSRWIEPRVSFATRSHIVLNLGNIIYHSAMRLICRFQGRSIHRDGMSNANEDLCHLCQRGWLSTLPVYTYACGLWSRNPGCHYNITTSVLSFALRIKHVPGVA